MSDEAGTGSRVDPTRPAMFEVQASGFLTLLQDEGRPGFAHLGVTASGAADRGAYAAANRLVGNRPGAACLEVTFGGLRMRALRTAFVAVTGAPATVLVQRAGASTAGFESPTGYAFTVFAGEVVEVAAPTEGLRNYLALRGGFAAEPVLGSRSTDVLSGLGPAPLKAGDILSASVEAGDWPPDSFIPPPLPSAGPVRLTLTRGPRDDWFGDRGWRALLDQLWTVSPESNRVGVRMALAAGGAALLRAPGYDGELPSEGMVAGAVQVPPSGHPVLFLRDHPVTGGYPVIGVLTEAAVDLAAQLRPGVGVRFASAFGSELQK
ncbi:biotin-dependent carboxyltransferase family protein [Herbiconiux sp. YIM B11900]|uniref:5-oxoprolinase subunit C family protein n=1 Tax=Herbiconiux sp. YIM B11900 TaxID=3404131 RepID=UPI003F85ADDB